MAERVARLQQLQNKQTHRTLTPTPTTTRLVEMPRTSDSWVARLGALGVTPLVDLHSVDLPLVVLLSVVPLVVIPLYVVNIDGISRTLTPS